MTAGERLIAALVLVTGPLVALTSVAGGVEPSVPTASELANSPKIDVMCQVRPGQVTALQGEADSCLRDNATVTAMLLEQGFDVSKTSYRLVVSTRRIPPLPNQNTPLELVDYALTLAETDPALMERLKVLAQQGYIKTHLPESKAPVSCYVFGQSNQINGLCHYGLFTDDRVEGVIDELRQAISTSGRR